MQTSEQHTPRTHRKDSIGKLGRNFNQIETRQTLEAGVRFDTRDSNKFYNNFLSKFSNEKTFPFPNNVTDENKIQTTEGVHVGKKEL
jgi:outer membrane receptor for Fe3+-dicitrate